MIDLLDEVRALLISQFPESHQLATKPSKQRVFWDIFWTATISVAQEHPLSQPDWVARAEILNKFCSLMPCILVKLEYSKENRNNYHLVYCFRNHRILPREVTVLGAYDLILSHEQPPAQITDGASITYRKHPL